MRVAHAIRVTCLALIGSAACGAAAHHDDAVAHHEAVVVAPRDGNSFVVRDVRVFDGQHVIEHANVVVRAGRITAVGHDAPPADLPAVDGTGRTLLPGLIDAHAHVQT